MIWYYGGDYADLYRKQWNKHHDDINLLSSTEVNVHCGMLWLFIIANVIVLAIYLIPSRKSIRRVLSGTSEFSQYISWIALYGIIPVWWCFISGVYICVDTNVFAQLYSIHMVLTRSRPISKIGYRIGFTVLVSSFLELGFYIISISSIYHQCL